MHTGARFFVILLLATSVLATGCAATKKSVPEDPLKQALLADSRYCPETVPPEAPPQRAASFRVAAKGCQALREGRLQAAEDQLERALSLDPRNPFCYFYLAQIRYQARDYRQAILLLNQSAIHFAGHPYWLSEVCARKGLCLEELGQIEEALREYTKSLEYDPWNETSLEALERIGSPLG